jgi:hypothetical protein
MDMNSRSWLSQMVVGGLLVVTFTFTGRLQLAFGQHELPPLPPGQPAEWTVKIGAHEIQAIERASKSLLAELGPGFTVTVTKTPHHDTSACRDTSAICCEEIFNRLSSDLAVCDAPCGTLTAKFVRLGCPCTATGECHCADQAVCGCDCPQAQQVATCPAACDAKCASEPVAIAAHHTTPHEHVAGDPAECTFLQLITSLVEEKATAQAELAVRKEATEKQIDLYGRMAHLLAANAALEAKIAAQAEHAKLAEKLAELAAENSRLKAHVELASRHAEANQHVLSLTLENERLELRLAELERQHAVEDTQTATRRTDRKAR